MLRTLGRAASESHRWGTGSTGIRWFYHILWHLMTPEYPIYIHIYGICMDMCGYVCTWVHIYYVDLTLCPCCLCSPTRIACCPASPKPRPCAVVCSVLKHTFHLSAASKESSESQIHLLKIVSLSTLIIYLWYLWSMFIFDKFKVALKCLWFFAATRCYWYSSVDEVFHAQPGTAPLRYRTGDRWAKPPRKMSHS